MQNRTVPFSAVLTGETSFNTNPRGCAIGFTTITDARGTASHLGVTTMHSEHCVNEANEFTGSMVLTAANGDEVHATYSGKATAPAQIGDEIHVTGTAVFAGGTGRFVHASGTGDVTATLTFEGFGDPSWPIRWECTGSLSY